MSDKFIVYDFNKKKLLLSDCVCKDRFVVPLGSFCNLLSGWYVERRIKIYISPSDRKIIGFSKSFGNESKLSIWVDEQGDAFSLGSRRDGSMHFGRARFKDVKDIFAEAVYAISKYGGDDEEINKEVIDNLRIFLAQNATKIIRNQPSPQEILFVPDGDNYFCRNPSSGSVPDSGVNPIAAGVGAALRCGKNTP